MLTTAAAPPPADDPWLGCNPFDPAFRDDPYPSLARLREIDPVNEMPVGIWRLTRYADVNRLLHDVPAGVRTTDGVLPGVDESLTGGISLTTCSPRSSAPRRPATGSRRPSCSRRRSGS